jgi:hypothetical protein
MNLETTESLIQLAFFWAVRCFQDLSAATGLSYALLNILFYCICVPYLWTTLASIRMRWRAFWAFSSLTAIGVGYYLMLVANQANPEFYARQIAFLYRLASDQEGAYMEISIGIGIAAPIATTAALIFGPRRWIPWIYFAALAIVGIYLVIGWYVCCENR